MDFSPAQQPGPENQPVPVDKHELPYNIAERPTPIGTDLETLLPREVGAYIREPIDPSDSLENPIYASYTHDKGDLFVELAIAGDASKAQRALGRAKAETDAEFPNVPQVFVTWQDVLCLKTVNRLGAFMAWTRGPYFFSAHAKGGENDLNEFMAAFPY